MRKLQINESLLLHDKETVTAFRAWARMKGWRTVQRAEPPMTRVWRLEDAQ
jgi:hypothetical protein